MATAAQAKDFIKKVAPIIQKYAKKYGYKVASPIIAQACIESAYGTSSLGYKYHNYFGMKCGSSWKGKSVNLSTKEEYQAGTLTSIKANFRVYASLDEGIEGYFIFISSKRYENLKSAETPEEFLRRIKADGYATSSTYVNTNMSCVDKYDLRKFDDFNEILVNCSDITAKYPTIKRGSFSTAVAVWSAILIREDYLKYSEFNDLFSDAISEATKKYQLEHSLKADGIVGPLTWQQGLSEL